MNLREKIDTIVKSIVARELEGFRAKVAADEARSKEELGVELERVRAHYARSNEDTARGLRGRIATLERRAVSEPGSLRRDAEIAALRDRVEAIEGLMMLELGGDADSGVGEAGETDGDAELVRSLLVDFDPKPKKVFVGGPEIGAALGMTPASANTLLNHYEKAHGRLPRRSRAAGRPQIVVRADRLEEVARLGREAQRRHARARRTKEAPKDETTESPGGERVRTRAEVLADPDRKLESLQARAEKTLLRAASRTKYATAARQATKAVRTPNRFVPLGHYPDPKKVREGVRYAFKREQNGANVGRLNFKEEGRQLLARWAP